MPWQECDRMSLRREFVWLAGQEGANVAELCRRFGISRKTGYKWMERFTEEGVMGLADRSRRPRRSPDRTEPAVEQKVVALRRDHPAWGGRKLRRRLQDLGHADVPAASTITGILHRHDLIDPAHSEQRRPVQRFERPRPNDLWQMDFKGHFTLASGQLCHPLTMLDDHSRFALAVRACGDQQYLTVREQLTGTFQRYGLPRAMLMDNGTPWGLCGRVHVPTLGLTRLTAWLMRLDVRPIHCRPFHPQTQGKDERFHRTLKVELLRDECFDDHAHAQRAFEPWRWTYNHERPHEALDLATPATRYRPSVRVWPGALPPLEYLGSDQTRAVNRVGQFQFQGRTWKISEALGRQRIGLRPTNIDGRWAIYFSRFHVADLDQPTRTIRRRRCQLPLATLAPPDNAAPFHDTTP